MLDLFRYYSSVLDAERQQLQMTVVRGEAIGVTVYDHFPRLGTVTNGALQIIFGFFLIAASIPNQMRLWACEKDSGHEINELVPGVDASLWVWIFTKCIECDITAVIGVFHLAMHPQRIAGPVV